MNLIKQGILAATKKNVSDQSTPITHEDFPIYRSVVVYTEEKRGRGILLIQIENWMLAVTDNRGDRSGVSLRGADTNLNVATNQ